MRRLFVPLLFGSALPALTGCERPLVDPELAAVTATTPDLSVVQTEAVLPLQIHVSDGDGVHRVTVDGIPATPTSVAGTFLDTLDLRFGLNTAVVAIYDANDNVTVDTLYAVHLPYGASAAPPLPEPRYDHTATRLPDGRILIIGGFIGGNDLATPTALMAQEAGSAVTYSDAPGALAYGRAGHTATLLPDGRVLVLGGVRTRSTTLEIITVAEVFDPATGEFSAVPVVGEPLRRYEHATTALTGEGGRVFIYVYGGLEAAGGGATTTGSLVAFELRDEGDDESLVTLSPPGGLGALPPTYGHALLPLPAEGEAQQTLAVGSHVDGGLGTPLVRRLHFRPSSTFFPFEVTDEQVGAPEVPLNQFGAAVIDPGLLLVGGGTALDGNSTPIATPSDGLRVYADGAARFFSFPEAVRLLIPRSGHTATLLPSGRILLLGGLGPNRQALAQAEFIGFN